MGSFLHDFLLDYFFTLLTRKETSNENVSFNGIKQSSVQNGEFWVTTFNEGETIQTCWHINNHIVNPQNFRQKSWAGFHNH